GSYGGEVSLWDLKSGSPRWRKPPPPSSWWINDISFAWDGRSCVVTYQKGLAFVYATETGEQIAQVPLSGAESRAARGALSPDGLRAAFIFQPDYWHAGELVLADALRGPRRGTGIPGFGPIRYSGDGRYVAFLTTTRVRWDPWRRDDDPQYPTS